MAVFGKASSKSLDVYAAIVEANRVIINAIAPGTPCSEVYRVGAEVFEKSGFGDLMTSTSVGHGIGLDAHEMPNLGRDNDQPLVEGMVVTVEPWIATRELGPLNLEDMVIVRKHGAELISKELRETTPLTKTP
jgi:Xaa-Pro aminopeptidase/Xaa-Pro dipeptidase